MTIVIPTSLLRQQAVRHDHTGTAGYKHVQLCQLCKDGHETGAECTCKHNCAHSKCPLPVTRLCPVLYSEGFEVPPVPTFERVPTDGNEP